MNAPNFKPSRFTDASPETRVVATAMQKYARNAKGVDWRLMTGQALAVLNALDQRDMLANKGDEA